MPTSTYYAPEDEVVKGKLRWVQMCQIPTLDKSASVCGFHLELEKVVPRDIKGDGKNGYDQI